MKAITTLFYLLIPVAFLTSCNNTPSEVEKVIRHARQNKKELQKVIDHFKKTGERKKCKAAYFLDEEGKANEYKMNPSITQDVTLYRKYAPAKEFIKYTKGMVGSKIQVSNDINFKNTIDIYTINSQPVYFEPVNNNKEETFRYIRYLGSDTSDIRIAEIQIFDNSNNNYSGKIYGYIKEKDKYESIPENAFDGDIHTNFNATKGSWVAMDLGTTTKRKIKKIKNTCH